jgi:regulator of protease activity HflC (stomatin/prohibitin superfamily)
VATLIGVILAPFMLVTVPSGYVGVLWKRFGGGTVLNPNLLKNEGMRITLPWNQVFLYDLRLQSVTQSYNAISRDGISLTASINIRFRLKRDSVPQLHQSIGPNYIDTLIAPEIGNRTREVMAGYTAEDIYSTKRAEIQGKIRERAEAMLGEKLVVGGESEEVEANVLIVSRFMPCSISSTRLFSALSCRPQLLARLIVRLSSIIFRRNTSSV